MADFNTRNDIDYRMRYVRLYLNHEFRKILLPPLEALYTKMAAAKPTEMAAAKPTDPAFCQNALTAISRWLRIYSEFIERCKAHNLEHEINDHNNNKSVNSELHQMPAPIEGTPVQLFKEFEEHRQANDAIGKWLNTCFTNHAKEYDNANKAAKHAKKLNENENTLNTIICFQINHLKNEHDTLKTHLARAAASMTPSTNSSSPNNWNGFYKPQQEQKAILPKAVFKKHVEQLITNQVYGTIKTSANMYLEGDRQNIPSTTTNNLYVRRTLQLLDLAMWYDKARPA